MLDTYYACFNLVLKANMHYRCCIVARECVTIVQMSQCYLLCKCVCMTSAQNIAVLEHTQLG